MIRPMSLLLFVCMLGMGAPLHAEDEGSDMGSEPAMEEGMDTATQESQAPAPVAKKETRTKKQVHAKSKAVKKIAKRDRSKIKAAKKVAKKRAKNKKAQ